MLKKDKNYQLRLEQAQFDRYKACAERRNMNVADWLRDACDGLADMEEAEVREKEAASARATRVLEAHNEFLRPKTPRPWKSNSDRPWFRA